MDTLMAALLRVVLWLVPAVGLGAAGLAVAQGQADQQYDVFSFSSEASKEVANDLMVAILAVQHEDQDSAILADRINATAAWATNVLRPYATLSFRTRNYQTYPYYDRSESRRLIGWRGTQQFELQTEDFEAAGKAIQELQEKLNVQSIQLSVKPETRQKTSDQLMVEALNRFRDRARLIQNTIGRSGFKILQVDVTSGHGGAQPYILGAQTEDYSVRSVQTEPALEAGTTRVSVHVSGSIQLD